MIDLDVLKRTAAAGPGTDEVPITRDCLEQIVAELAAGREAQQRLGALAALHGRRI